VILTFSAGMVQRVPAKEFPPYAHRGKQRGVKRCVAGCPHPAILPCHPALDAGSRFLPATRGEEKKGVKRYTGVIPGHSEPSEESRTIWHG